ncbi:MAG: NAD(P)-dependent oxidoreductase [Alphaproteobacteria bacterium]|nr:NAD(P)-dependent oxidoreductase [Alphaproteobacteria bacterium]
MILAVTGGTGFVGSRLLKMALAQGHEVRALTRSERPMQPGVSWIPGDLDAETALARLCDGADAVIHIAGVINAPDRAGFLAGNAGGTGRMVRAAETVGVRRFVHVSSLAAREPGLSMYGMSKAESEARVRDSRLDWSIVRPPGVYGPGDRETLELFTLAKRGLALVPWQGRASWIHADDLSAALLHLAGSAGSSDTFEIDDGTGGYDHPTFARMVGAAVGRRVAVLRAPNALMSLAALAATAATRPFGRLPKLSRDRARYFAHPDWTAHGPAPAGWSPAIPTPQGLAETAGWYREAGWL